MLSFLLLALPLLAQEEAVLNELERPFEVNEEGVYYYKVYEQETQKKKTRFGQATEMPDGSYIYQVDKTKDDPVEKYGAPNKISGTAYIYDSEKSEQSNSVTVQFTQLKFEDFRSGNDSYDDVYEPAKGLLVDYEWQYDTRLARFGFILSSGLFVAHGQGRFQNLSLSAKEEYDLYIVPLVGKLRINFQYIYNQYVMPYAEAGAGAIGIIERRDDGDDNTTAYTPIFTASGGLAFLLDWMMGSQISRLDNDMGVNHMWLTVSYHLITATDDEYDLSDSQIAAGFKVDF